MEKEIRDFETFLADATEDSNSTKITIPSKYVKFMGIEKGDTLKILVQIVTKKNK